MNSLYRSISIRISTTFKQQIAYFRAIRKNTMRILIDMDDVMADSIERFFEWYERDFGIRELLSSLTFRLSQ